MLESAPMCCHGGTAGDGIVEWDICRGDGVDGGVVLASTSKASRGDELVSLAMAVAIGFGVGRRGGMCPYKMFILRLCFPTVIVSQ